MITKNNDIAIRTMEKCKRELTIIFYRSYRYIVSIVDVICIYPAYLAAEGNPAYPVQYLWVIGWTSRLCVLCSENIRMR